MIQARSEDSRISSCDGTLALGPDSRFCDGLVEAGVVKRIGIGSKVMALKTKDYGVVTGWTDGNTEVVVRWDNGTTSAASAGKR